MTRYVWQIDFAHWLHPVKGVIFGLGGSVLATGSAALALDDVPAGLWLALFCALLVGFLVVVVVLRTVIYFEFAVHKGEEEALVRRVESTGESFDAVSRTHREWRQTLQDSVTQHGHDISRHDEELRKLAGKVTALEELPILRRPGGV